LSQQADTKVVLTCRKDCKGLSFDLGAGFKPGSAWLKCARWRLGRHRLPASLHAGAHFGLNPEGTIHGHRVIVRCHRSNATMAYRDQACNAMDRLHSKSNVNSPSGIEIMTGLEAFWFD